MTIEHKNNATVEKETSKAISEYIINIINSPNIEKTDQNYKKIIVVYSK